jgi:hypothetical protein
MIAKIKDKDKLMQSIFAIDFIEPYNNGDIVKIEKIDNDELAEVRGGFWSMLNYIIKTKQLHKLPEGRREFFSGEQPHALKLSKLYYMIRWDLNFTEIGYDKTGLEIVTVSSTSKISVKDFKEFSLAAYQWFCENGLDMEQYEKEWTKRRTKGGKQ